MVYYSLPVLSWKLLYEPVFASVISPLADDDIEDKLQSVEQKPFTADSMNFTDSWFLEYSFKKTYAPAIASYTISIPKLNIQHAFVSTVDDKLDEHLVQYWGSALPPLLGNTVIFGHSTLPQLFDAKNYRTIFAHIHELQVNDFITVHIDKNDYTYKVNNITITTPDDISMLSQNTNGHYLTIITCTPPGTTWKRLIIKSELIKT